MATPTSNQTATGLEDLILSMDAKVNEGQAFHLQFVFCELFLM
jgi:hypothetical protein